MILDASLSFSTPASPDALAQVAGTYTANNILDLGLSGIPSSPNGGGARDLGIGDDPALKLVVQVSTTFTSGGAATLQIVLQGAPDNGSGSPGSYSTMLQSSALALSTLVVGARLLDIDVPRPPPGQALPRFLRLQYVIGTATTTAGACISSIVLDRDDQPAGTSGNLSGYPAGINIAN